MRNDSETPPEERSPKQFREKRESVGASQNDIAKRASIQRPRISKWERGKEDLGAIERNWLWEALEEYDNEHNGHQDESQPKRGTST